MSFESLPRQREQNHFNLIRMIAASSVILSHSGNLSVSWDTPDPLYSLIGIDLGATAVLAFFAISGYFISLSFERRASNSGEPRQNQAQELIASCPRHRVPSVGRPGGPRRGGMRERGTIG